MKRTNILHSIRHSFNIYDILYINISNTTVDSLCVQEQKQQENLKEKNLVLVKCDSWCRINRRLVMFPNRFQVWLFVLNIGSEKRFIFKFTHF